MATVVAVAWDDEDESDADMPDAQLDLSVSSVRTVRFSSSQSEAQPAEPMSVSPNGLANVRPDPGRTPVLTSSEAGRAGSLDSLLGITRDPSIANSRSPPLLPSPTSPAPGVRGDKYKIKCLQFESSNSTLKLNMSGQKFIAKVDHWPTAPC